MSRQPTSQLLAFSPGTAGNNQNLSRPFLSKFLSAADKAMPMATPGLQRMISVIIKYRRLKPAAIEKKHRIQFIVPLLKLAWSVSRGIIENTG
jgi:hypothetical protein